MAPLFLFGVKFAGKFIAGAFLGSRDAILEEFTDSDISKAVRVRDMLTDCEPWSNHLNSEGIRQMNNAIKKDDVSTAIKAIDNNLLDTRADWCIAALKLAVEFACTKCPRILSDALPSSYY